jgi:hypothetical protein
MAGSNGRSNVVVGAENGISPRSGSKMMKTHLIRSFKPTGDYRQEITQFSGEEFTGKFEKGKEYWVGVSVFIPEDWSTDYRGFKNGKLVKSTSGGIILQMHDAHTADPTWRHGLTTVVAYTEDGFRIWNRASECHRKKGADLQGCLVNQRKGNKLEIFSEDAPMEIGQWNDFVFNVKYSPNSDGFVKVWVNGEDIVNSHGANYYSEYTDKYYPFFKMGLYQPQFKKFGWSKDIVWEVEERTLYHDEVRIGDSTSDYQEVAP